MTLERIKTTLAAHIASSNSTNIPSRVQAWAQNQIGSPEGTQATNSTNGTNEGTPASSSTPNPVSSNSTLPTLELALETTKINTRSCLKKPKRWMQRGWSEPTKRVRFVIDDALVTCMATGSRMLPVESTNERCEAFLSRSGEQHEQRRAEKKARRAAAKTTGIARALDSSSNDSNDGDDDDDDDEEEEEQCPWDNFDPDEPEDPSGVLDPRVPAEKALQERVEQAERHGVQLNMRAVACGSLDFALYVTRNRENVSTLESMAYDYSGMLKIASYKGEERRHAHHGIYALTTVPAGLYEDYLSAMSGHRAPAVMLRTPVAPVGEENEDEAADAAPAS